MSHPSQIFQQILSPQEVFELESKLEEFRSKNQELSYVNGKFKERIQQLQDEQVIYVLQTKQLSHLSKAYLKLGLATLRNQKEEINNQPEVQSQYQNIHQKTISQGQEMSNVQFKQLQHCLAAKETENNILIVKINSLKEQYQRLYKDDIQTLNKRIRDLQEDMHDKDILINNQRLIHEKKIQHMEKREQMFKKAEEKLQQKQKELSLRAQQTQIRLQNMRGQLNQQYTNKKQALQLQYIKRLQSLRDYTELQSINESLKNEKEALELTVKTLKQQKLNLLNKIGKKQSIIQQYKNMHEYRQAFYKSENVDNLIVSLYQNKLQQFYSILQESGQKSIEEKLQMKKKQLIETLDLKLNKSIIKRIRR